MCQKKIFQLLFIILGLSSLLEAIPPNAPGPYLGASKVKDSNDSVRFSFRDNSNNEKMFRVNIYNSENNALFKSIETNASNQRYGYATVTGLNCDKVYKATVIASNDEGDSAPSSSAFFSMQSTFEVSCLNNSEVPNPPGEYLGVTDINETAVRVSFLDNSDNEDGFIVYGEGIYVKVPKNDEAQHSFQYATLSNLSCNKSYNIKALAYNSEGNSSSSSSHKFNIEKTFNLPCTKNIPPSVSLDITYRTIQNGDGTDLRVFEISAKATDIDGKIVQCQWSGGRSCEGNSDFSVIMGLGDEYIFHSNEVYTITVTDDKGATTTNSLVVYDPWYEKEANDSIYIGGVPNVLKVGQTILVDAYVNDIIPRTSCGTSVHGHSWGGSLGLVSFDDSMYDTGHFICYGYRASTAITATQKGDARVSLYANNVQKNFSIKIVDINNSKDTLKKVVIDNLTGLVWADTEPPLKSFITENNYQLYNLHDYSGDTAKTYCETLEWGGYTDWRLPTLFEITGYVAPDSDQEYWSSTKIPNDRDVSSMLSSKVVSKTKNQKLFTLCVRH